MNLEGREEKGWGSRESKNSKSHFSEKTHERGEPLVRSQN